MDYMHAPKERFKTVDDLIHYYVDGLEDNSARRFSSIKQVVYNLPYMLLDTLRSKNNLPSKYDLQIIQATTSALEMSEINSTTIYLILDEYKNRKVL